MSTNFSSTGGEQLPPPIEPTFPPPNFQASGRAIGDGLADSKIKDQLKADSPNWAVETAAALVGWFIGLVTKIVSYFLRIIVKGESDAEREMATVARLMISDLFNTEIDESKLQMRRGKGARPPEYDLLGGAVLRGLFDRFDDTSSGELQPSDAGARKAIGSVVGSTVEGVIQGAIIESLSGGWVRGLTDLDDNIANALGLGRVSSRALRPAIDILISTPFEWKLMKQYRPTMLTTSQYISEFLAGRITRADLDEQLARKGYSAKNIEALIRDASPSLTASQLVRQFHRGRLTREQLNKDLAGKGYSAAAIEALVNEGAKFIGLSDLAFLERQKFWTRDETKAELLEQGFDDRTADNLLDIERLKRSESLQREMVSLVRDLYRDRFLSTDEARRWLRTFEPDEEVVADMLRIEGFNREMRRKRLSESDAETAVKRAFWTFGEYEEYLAELGYGPSETLVKRLLIQDEIAQDAAARKKREDAERARAEEKRQRLAAAAARQAELDSRTRVPQLTLSQVTRAAVRGTLTAAQFVEYLASQGYASGDVALLVSLFEADRVDYINAQERRAATEAKIAATSLTAVQLQKAVVAGAVTFEEYAGVLRAQGVSEEEVQILVGLLRADVDAARVAANRAGAVSRELRERGVSLSQLERAVRLELLSMTDYRARLAALGFPIEDQEILAGLLAEGIARDREAVRRQEEIDRAAAVRKISLADLRAAVKKKLRPIGDYRAALQQLGYGPLDIDTLIALLQSTMTEDGIAADRKIEIIDAARIQGIALEDIEREVALGISDITRYEAALTFLELPAEDAAVLLADVEEWAAVVQEAMKLEGLAEARFESAALSLPRLKHRFLFGSEPMDNYRAALAGAGLAPDQVEQLATLLAWEIAEVKYATAYRRALDATQAPRELLRSAEERAVMQKDETLGVYAAWLAIHDYSADEQSMLAWLLSFELG
jgi:hypothetical protein